MSHWLYVQLHLSLWIKARPSPSSLTAWNETCHLHALSVFLEVTMVSIVLGQGWHLPESTLALSVNPTVWKTLHRTERMFIDLSSGRCDTVGVMWITHNPVSSWPAQGLLAAFGRIFSDCSETGQVMGSLLTVVPSSLHRTWHWGPGPGQVLSFGLPSTSYPHTYHVLSPWSLFPWEAGTMTFSSVSLVFGTK